MTAAETAALADVLRRFMAGWEKATDENSRAVAKAVGHDAYNELWDLMPLARAALSAVPRDEGDAAPRFETWVSRSGSFACSADQVAKMKTACEPDLWALLGSFPTFEAARAAQIAWDTDAPRAAASEAGRPCSACKGTGTCRQCATHMFPMDCHACHGSARASEAGRGATDAEAWRLEVAEALGFVNRPEGQGGYEVADASVVAAVFKRMERERDEAQERWARDRGEHSRLHPLLDGADDVLDRVRAALNVPPGASVVAYARDLAARASEAGRGATEALEAATRSLEWIAERTIRSDESSFDAYWEVRQYARSRATVARAALAAPRAAPTTTPERGVHSPEHDEIRALLGATKEKP